MGGQKTNSDTTFEYGRGHGGDTCCWEEQLSLGS